MRLQPATQLFPSTPGSSGLLCLVVAVLTPAFYLIEHRNADVSNLEAYTISGTEMAERASEGDAGRRLAIPAIAALGAILLLRHGEPLSLQTPLAWLLVAYVLWSALSIFWSADLTLTARHVIVLLLCALGAIGIARQLSMRELTIVALAVSTILVLNSFCIELTLGTFRPWSADYRFAGALHPNVQAPYCATMALSAACLAATARRGRGWLWMLFLIGGVLLILTKSRTVVAMFVALVVVYAAHGVAWPRRVMAGTAVLACICLLAMIGSLLGWDLQGQTLDLALIGRQDDTRSLSGRLPLWAELLPNLEDHALLGYGYQTFWDPQRIDNLSGSIQWTVTDGHSAYLDTLFDLGLVGAIICVGTVVAGIAAAAHCYRLSNDAGDCFVLILLVGRALNAVVESAFCTPTTFVSFITIVALVHLGFCTGAVESLPVTSQRRVFVS